MRGTKKHLCFLIIIVENRINSVKYHFKNIDIAVVYICLRDFTKITAKYIMKNIEYESEMTLWDVNGTTLKRKRPKKIKIRVEFMPNSAKKYM